MLRGVREKVLQMRINHPVVIGLTITLALVGTAEGGVITVGSLQSDQHDHDVPRVPLALAGGSGPTSTISISTGAMYTANMISGDEYRVPPTDNPRAGAAMLVSGKDKFNQSYNELFFFKPRNDT